MSPSTILNIILVAMATFEAELETSKRIEVGSLRSVEEPQWLGCARPESSRQLHAQQEGHLLRSRHRRRVNDGGLRVASHRFRGEKQQEPIMYEHEKAARFPEKGWRDP